MTAGPRRSALRSALVSALATCCERPLRSPVRRFLVGLSSDELEFIAGFMGSCILEASGEISGYRPAREDALTDDQNHKMILVREFLCRGGLRPAPSPMRPTHA